MHVSTDAARPGRVGAAEGWMKGRWKGATGAVILAIGIVVGCGSSSMPGAGADGSGSGFNPLSGPCSPEGTVRTCRVKRGDDGTTLSCFEGQQECRGGVWSACGGQSITLMGIDIMAAQSLPQDTGLRPLAVPTADAGVCTQDPCDPNCVGYNETDAQAPTQGPPTFIYNTTDIFGGAPGGFAGKSDCGSSAKGCNDVAPGAPYKRKCNGEDHYSIWDSCLADTHCDRSRNGGEGECVANWDTSATTDPRWDAANRRWSAATCPGVDVTVSAACVLAGTPGFNVCNRGNTTLTAASVALSLDNGNGNFGSSTFASGTCPTNAVACSPAIPGGVLLPGRCFRVTNANCPAWTGNGNPVTYVNANKAIAECGGDLTAAAATGPGCNNNWADVKVKGGSCGTSGVTFTQTDKLFTYTAACQSGTKPRWKWLTYNATVPCSPGACGTDAGTPNNSKVEFYGTLSTTLVDGGTSSAPEAIIGDATTTSTVNCSAAGPAGPQPKCPVDLATWADGVTAGGSTFSKLDLKIRLIPTANTLAAPTVVSWAVSYDCVPTE